jgi:hypothetical protein
MLPKTLAISILAFAAGSILAVPGAVADSGSADFWSQLNSTDGGATVFAHVPDRPKVPATPEQAANLRYQEAQRQITDGAANPFADIPDRPKVPATPEQAANLRFLEAQRQISDGSGHMFPGGKANASEAPSRHAEAIGNSGDGVQ